MSDRRTVVGERELETWLSIARLAGFVFAACEIGIFVNEFPDGYRMKGWWITIALGIGTIVLYALARWMPSSWEGTVGFLALAFDTCIIAAYATVFSYEYGNQVRWALVLVVAEAALRYGLLGGLLMPVVLIPVLAYDEHFRAHHFGPPGFTLDRVSFPTGVLLLSGLVVGWLVKQLDRRAQEAEALRDELGRHVDVLEAANRCAVALGSSLEMDEAFGAFIVELKEVIPFDRAAIVLVENDQAATIATAGVGAGDVLPPGSFGPLEGSPLGQVLTGGTIVQRDLTEGVFREDALLVALGLRSRILAPLPVGARPIGALAISRKEADAFSDEEVELISLLGRLVATAVQNIRSYDAERRRVEELHRLSAMRADFVSLVSHELRSPMAAVIGAARTLQERRRELSVEQREAFLALIANETNRLAVLIGDVLDTSRIEAGTFSYSFGEVDLMRLIDDVVTLASVGQEEVAVRAAVSGQLPPVHGDRERLRQVLSNLVDNAVKYSDTGGAVEVKARTADGVVQVSVTDHGPGIPREQQHVIFEKFGRATGTDQTKPGTGLGLFIARSIAEAHGGSLDVESAPEAGATFTLTLPATT